MKKQDHNIIPRNATRIVAEQIGKMSAGRPGDIWECWWDGAGSTEACYDWKRWVKIVRENQKNCVIFGSLGATEFVDVRWVGNEKGIAGEPCYSTIDASSLIGAILSPTS